jgi:hypothetical protein
MSFDNGFKFVTTSASGGSSLTLSPAQFLSNTKVVITLAGSVGIATTSPLYNLQVGANAGIIGTTAIHLANSYLDSNGYFGARITALDNGVDGSNMQFQTRNSGPGTFVNSMTLTTAGKVGIGNTAPTALLDMRGGSISLGSYDSSSGSRYVGFYNANDANGPLVGMEIENTTLGGNYSQKLHFRTHLYGGNNGRRLTIDENGDVSTTKNLTTGNPYWFITSSTGGNATYSAGAVWFSSTASGTYGDLVGVGGTALTSAFNKTSGAFTFPVAGTYLISVPMFINGATGGRYAIATFGSSIAPVSQYFEFTSTNLPSNEMRTWTYVKQVNAGDTMYLSTPAGSITLFIYTTHSCLNIFKIG